MSVYEIEVIDRNNKIVSFSVKYELPIMMIRLKKYLKYFDKKSVSSTSSSFNMKTNYIHLSMNTQSHMTRRRTYIYNKDVNVGQG